MSKTVDDLHEIYRNARLGEIFAAKDEELVTDVRERAERDRLKAALQPFSDAYERLVRTQESMGFSDNASFGLGIKVSAIKAARKALGGDAS